MEYKTLNQIATNFRYGKMPDKSKITDSGDYPVWSGYRYVGFYDGKNVNKDEIVVVARGVGGTGDVKICKEDCFLTNLSIAFNVNEDINPLYVYYYYQIKNLRYLDSGSAQSQITINDLKNVKIPIPSKNIQDKIVEVLNKLDQRIELNNEINNNLYKLIKNNYESLINGCNWEEVELGAISNITSGKRPVDKSETGEYSVIGANGIMAYASDYNFNEDLIITGRVGTLGVVKRYLGKIWASDNTLVIQTKYLNYIENYLKTIDYYSLNRGSTQPLLTQGDLKKQIIYFNGDSVIKFEKDNQMFVDKIRNNEKENSKLIQLRDTLLPKLMNGEIDLDNIEI